MLSGEVISVYVWLVCILYVVVKEKKKRERKCF